MNTFLVTEKLGKDLKVGDEFYNSFESKWIEVKSQELKYYKLGSDYAEKTFLVRLPNESALEAYFMVDVKDKKPIKNEIVIAWHKGVTSGGYWAIIDEWDDLYIEKYGVTKYLDKRPVNPVNKEMLKVLKEFINVNRRPHGERIDFKDSLCDAVELCNKFFQLQDKIKTLIKL